MTRPQIEAHLAKLRQQREALRADTDGMEYSASRWAMRGLLNSAQEAMRHAENLLVEALEWSDVV